MSRRYFRSPPYPCCGAIQYIPTYSLAGLDLLPALRLFIRNSPNPHPLLRLEIQLVARLYTERLVPSVDIAHRPIDAEACRRMNIGRDLLLERIGTRFGAPDLRPSQEH